MTENLLISPASAGEGHRTTTAISAVTAGTRQRSATLASKKITLDKIHIIAYNISVTTRDAEDSSPAMHLPSIPDKVVTHGGALFIQGGCHVSI